MGTSVALMDFKLFSPLYRMRLTRRCADLANLSEDGARNRKSVETFTAITLKIQDDIRRCAHRTKFRRGDVALRRIRALAMFTVSQKKNGRPAGGKNRFTFDIYGTQVGRVSGIRAPMSCGSASALHPAPIVKDPSVAVSKAALSQIFRRHS